MGCCGSSGGGDEGVKEDNKKLKQENVKKLLFLGPGGCGKSTLFKQLRQNFGGDIEKDERLLFHDHIWSFIIETVQCVLTLIEDKSKLSENAQGASDILISIDVKSRIDMTLAAQIKLLWNEELFRQVFEEEAKVKLFHSCSHFLSDIERIGSDNYVPTDLDILFQRRPTTGLVEQQICINETWFQVYDVGGQRNERRKWIHQFENVSAVVFVASLSSFDEPMYDDETTNSLEDSIQLFGETCDSEYFVHQHMILILNKQDLLQEKLKAGKKLRDKDNAATLDYSGPDDDLQQCIKYIEGKFRGAFEQSLARLTKSNDQVTAAAAQKRLLFVRIICAYELESVKSVFIDVQGILTGSITTNQ
jgi:guanine nucleotide-binding protein G(i) subunit alpha